jgi:hypothetical protein
MNTGSKSFWPLVAVGVGVSLVGYCVYFDRKRRSAPDFPEKLKASKYLNLLSVICLIKEIHPQAKLFYWIYKIFYSFRTKETETTY